VVDVGMRDDDVGDVARRPPDLGEGRQHVLLDRAGDAGVDEQQPLVADDEPLREPPHPQDGRDAVDTRLYLVESHGSKLTTISKRSE
jgi:hypothetical protein